MCESDSRWSSRSRTFDALTVSVSVRGHVERVLLHEAGPQRDGQELGVHEVLPHAAHDLARHLKQPLARPVRVEDVQLLLDCVVVAHPHGVQSCQPDQLVRSSITCQATGDLGE